MAFTLAVLFVVASQSAVGQAAPQSLPIAKTRIYEPISKGTDVMLGKMSLNTTRASFARLSGHMNIVFDGEADDPEGLGSGKAQIFRVKNAVPFFTLNKGKNGFCHKPIKWLGIAPMGNDVRVFFFTLDDYRLYSPIKPDLCEADTFRPRMPA